MVFTRGSGSGAGGLDRPGLTVDNICELIASKVADVVWGAIPEVFGSIKTVMINLFNERYVVVSKVAAVAATVYVATTWIQKGDNSSFGTSATRSPQSLTGSRTGLW